MKKKSKILLVRIGEKNPPIPPHLVANLCDVP